MNRKLRSEGAWEKRDGISWKLWTPASITTSLWLDASDASTITIATGVSQWNDKSGNNRNATQSTGANQPALVASALDGKSVVRFDGSNDTLAFDGTFFANTSYSLYVVVTRRSGGSFNFFIGGTVNGANNIELHGGWGGSTGVSFGHLGNNITLTVPAYTTPTPDLFGYILNTSNGKHLYINGEHSNFDRVVTALTSNNGARLGSFFDVSTVYYNGDIAEIVATNTVLSYKNHQKMEGYLAHKWGLTGNLPSAHPYKTSKPLK